MVVAVVVVVVTVVVAGDGGGGVVDNGGGVGGGGDGCGGNCGDGSARPMTSHSGLESTMSTPAGTHCI